jgi:DNA-directed RNA polymerase specialized sigma24 family protein
MSEPDADSKMPAGELVRRCGRDLGDRELWAQFQRRFQRRIFLYLMRASHASGADPEVVEEQLSDLAQQVYLRLVRNEGRVLRSFRQDSELSVRAFLARIATAVVSDHFRFQTAGKRQGQVISIDQARETIERIRGAGRDASSGQDSLLSLIDVERELALASAGNRARVARDLLIFRLYCVDGFTADELAAFPGFRLSAHGVETVVARIRDRLRDAR